MPRYDYKCEANDHVFEVTQSFTDDPVAFCPEDGSKAERQFSVPHVIYKGSGFYTTDYKNGGSSSRSDSNGSSESKKSKSESSGSGKSGDPGKSSASSSTAKSSDSSSSDSKS